MQTIRYQWTDRRDIFSRANSYRGIDLAQLPPVLYPLPFGSLIRRGGYYPPPPPPASPLLLALDDEEERACCDGALEKERIKREILAVPVQKDRNKMCREKKKSGSRQRNGGREVDCLAKKIAGGRFKVIVLKR